LGPSMVASNGLCASHDPEAAQYCIGPNLGT
jgi:hypothetical protein